jgi:cellulose biosynthesis protein BcsQ
MSREVIALLSGKGGSGKTAVCISAGHLLAAAGFRVLMVDADAATHGMTHYFAPSLHPGLSGLFESDLPHSVDHVTLSDEGYSGRLDFIPSVSFSKKPQIGSEESKIAALQLFNFMQASDPEKYDFVLIDCQAGISPVTLNAVKFATHTVIVTEADPVSIGAVTELRQAIATVSEGEIYGLVSKAFPDEDSYFEALTDYIRDIRFLGILPHDTDVRKAFFRREVPIRLSDPGPFAIALADAWSKLDRRLRQEIETSPTFKKFSQEEVSKEVFKLVRLSEALRDEISEISSREKRRQYIAVYSATLAVLSLVLIVVLTVLNVISRITGLGGALASVLLIAVSVLQFFLPSQPSKKRQRDLEALLRDIDDRIEDYITSRQIDREQLYREALGSSSLDMAMRRAASTKGAR